MNYLAHLYLSRESEEQMLGNFLGDFVKRKDFERYPAEIIKGIQLHHLIDAFTDRHPIVRQSKQKLRSRYRHYAGVIVDIYYDHFLARHWASYSPIPLRQFSAHAYSVMRKHHHILPIRVQSMLPHMESHDWLSNYAQMAGLQRVFQGMSRRTSFRSNMQFATEDLQQNYEEYEKEFLLFFAELIEFSKVRTADL